MKRGLYEIMWGAPQRDYGKYIGLDNKKKKQNFQKNGGYIGRVGI